MMRALYSNMVFPGSLNDNAGLENGFQMIPQVFKYCTIEPTASLGYHKSFVWDNAHTGYHIGKRGDPLEPLFLR